MSKVCNFSEPGRCRFSDPVFTHFYEHLGGK